MSNNYVWSITLFEAENGLSSVGKQIVWKALKWTWRRMQNIRWTHKSYGGGKDRGKKRIMKSVQKTRGNRIGYMLRLDCLIGNVTEGGGEDNNYWWY